MLQPRCHFGNIVEGIVSQPKRLYCYTYRLCKSTISPSDCATFDRQILNGRLLHNTATTPSVLEANLLPVCQDEVHLIVHANGPHNAFKIIAPLCFGDDN